MSHSQPQQLEPYPHHILSCSVNGDVNRRHNKLARTIAFLAQRAGQTTSTEPSGLLREEANTNLRPADTLINGEFAVDVTVVSALQNAYVSAGQCNVGKAAIAAESRKLIDYEDKCHQNHLVYMPFAIDTFGFVTPRGGQLINMLSTELSLQLNLSRRVTRILVKGVISASIHRSNARMVLKRRPLVRTVQIPPDRAHARAAAAAVRKRR